MSTAIPIPIVAFGDSLTQAVEQACDDRWPEIVARALRERYPGLSIRMVNAGVGGNTSREGLARIEQDVLEHDPRFVLVEFGNDATPEPDRQVSFGEFTANLHLIRTKVAERRGAQLVLLTFPPIVDEWHSHYRHEFYVHNGGQDAYQEHYRKRTRDFAQTFDCPLVDVDTAFRESMRTDGRALYILPDGVHLTARGNQLIASLVIECLSKQMAGLVGASDRANKASGGDVQ